MIFKSAFRRNYWFSLSICRSSFVHGIWGFVGFVFPHKSVTLTLKSSIKETQYEKGAIFLSVDGYFRGAAAGAGDTTSLKPQAGRWLVS